MITLEQCLRVLAQRCRKSVALLSMVLLSACAAQRGADQADFDPLEPFNRGMYQFNYVADGVLIKPVTKVYRGIVPEPGREAVHNFVYNLTEPVTVLNAALQLDPQRTFTSLWRFLLNSTLGVGGLFDFAGKYGLEPRQEDFGQTLGSYGVGPGPYIVLPLIGPSSLRDAFGMVVDYFSDPFSHILDHEEEVGRYFLEALDARNRTLELTDHIYATSFDPYASFRSAYLQRRDHEIRNGK